MPRQFQVAADGVCQLSSGCVDNEAMSSASPAGVDKTRHLHRCGTNFGQAVGDAPTDKEEVVYRAATGATVRAFRALLEETGTTTSVTYDLKKYNDANPTGVSILSGVVTITNATADRAAQSGGIATPTLVAGDVLTIFQDMTTNTGAAGPWAEIEVDEPAT